MVNDILEEITAVLSKESLVNFQSILGYSLTAMNDMSIYSSWLVELSPEASCIAEFLTVKRLVYRKALLHTYPVYMS